MTLGPTSCARFAGTTILHAPMALVCVVVLGVSDYGACRDSEGRLLQAHVIGSAVLSFLVLFTVGWYVRARPKQGLLSFPKRTHMIAVGTCCFVFQGSDRKVSAR